jgi:hypothetical protein
LAFTSTDPLTGVNSKGPCTYKASDESFTITDCREIFLYDAASGSLVCPSCNPSGASVLGPSSLTTIDTRIPQRPVRFVTDSGRLYFDSQDSLVPTDTNEGREDVYQYEPDGSGTCARSPGCTALISAGSRGADSNLAAIDAEGKNVFFTTWDPLALKDEDDLMDLYDAREGGGLAAETESKQSECQGEGCLPTVAPPNDPTPGSATFNGLGNVRTEAAKSCPKRKVRKKSKCVKRHSKKHSKKHSRKGAGHRSQPKNHRSGGAK